MSQIHKGIFGACAIALMLGAVQIAFGHDLAAGKTGTQAAAGTVINRAAKADRAAVPVSAIATYTIALQPDGLDDTSVLVRVPVAKVAGNRQVPRLIEKSGVRKTTIACE